jgi:5-methylcytosine-specific restriction endonuclease McrA
MSLAPEIPESSPDFDEKRAGPYDLPERINFIMDRVIRCWTEGLTPEEIQRRRDDYQSYLSSGQWWSKRQAVLQRAKGRCELCAVANEPLQVHHLSYGDRGQETLDELVALCPTCHERVHYEIT